MKDLEDDVLIAEESVSVCKDGTLEHVWYEGYDFKNIRGSLVMIERDDGIVTNRDRFVYVGDSDHPDSDRLVD